MADKALNIPMEFTAETGNAERFINKLSRKIKEAFNIHLGIDATRLSKELNKAYTEADLLQKELEKLQNTRVPTPEFEALTQEIENIRKSGAGLITAIQPLIDARNKLAEIRAELENVRNQKSAFLEALGNKKELKENLQAQLQELKAKYSEMQNVQKSIYEGTGVKISDPQMDALANRIQQVRQQLASVSGSYGNMLKNAEASVTAFDSKISQLTLDEEAQRTKLNELTQAHSSEIKALQEKSNKIEELKNKQQEMVANQTDTMLPQKQIDEDKKRIEELRTYINKLEETISQIKGESIVPNTEGIKKTGNDTKEAEKKAKEADIAYKKLAKTLGSVANSAAKATGKLLALPLKAVGKAISNVHSKMKNLQKMLGRMIIRKVFNLALQAIIKFAKESVQELAKFSGSFNKSISEMMSSFQYLGRNLVSAIAPLLEAITPLVTEFVDKITEAVIKVNSFFSAVTGKKQMVVAKKQQFDYAKSLEATADAAEEASKQLGYYDKLNVIGQDNKDSGISQESPFSYQNLDTQSAISDFAKKVKEAWKKADFTEVATILTNKFTGVLNKFNTDIVPKLEATATKLGRSLATFLNGVFNNTTMWEELGKSIGNVVNIIIRFFYEFITGTNWGSIGKALSLMLSNAISTIRWGELAKTISNGIIGFLDFAISFLENLDTQALGEAIATFLLNIDWWGIIKRVFKLIWVIIKSVVSTAFSTIATLFSESSTGGKVLLGIITAIITAMGVLKVVNFIPTLIQGIMGFAATVAKVLIPAFNLIKTLGGALVKGILVAGKGLLAFFTSPAGIITLIIAAIVALAIIIIKNRDKIKLALDVALAKVKEIVGKIIEKVNNLKDKVVDAFNKIKTGVLNVWEGIKSGIKSAVNWILGKIENFINGMISAINWFTSKINNVTSLLPDWAGGNKLQIRQIGYVQIPRLAQGAVIPPNKEFLAMLGDQKKGYNIETPLDTMIEAFETALDNRGNGGTSTIILQLDRREVARIVYDSMEKKYKQTGRFIKGVEV